MTIKFRTAFALTGALALAACGSSDDASEAAVADTVEIPADEAMAGVTAEPVVDEEVVPAAAPAAEGDADEDTDGPAPTEADVANAETAGEAAAAAAADVAAIAAAANADQSETEVTE